MILKLSEKARIKTKYKPSFDKVRDNITKIDKKEKSKEISQDSEETEVNKIHFILLYKILMYHLIIY